MWNDELKVALIKRIASDELGISDEEMEWRLDQLATLLPGAFRPCEGCSRYQNGKACRLPLKPRGSGPCLAIGAMLTVPGAWSTCAGLVPRLMRAPPAMVARAAAHTVEIGHRLLRIKAAFPEANCMDMISNRMSLLLDDDMEQARQNAWGPSC